MIAIGSEIMLNILIAAILLTLFSEVAYAETPKYKVHQIKYQGISCTSGVDAVDYDNDGDTDIVSVSDNCNALSGSVTTITIFENICSKN